MQNGGSNANNKSILELAVTLFLIFNFTPYSLMLSRQSKLRPSLDHLAIVYCFVAWPALDWRSLYYQTELLQSGDGQANNK